MGKVEQLQLHHVMPLRILVDQRPHARVRTLNTPYEFAPYDNVVIRHLDENPTIALVTLLDAPEGGHTSGTQAFERFMFLSSYHDAENQQRILMTLSGYEFTEPVEIEAWQDHPELAVRLSREQQEQLNLVRRIQRNVLHVQDFEAAAKSHMTLIAMTGTSPDNISLGQAAEIYNAIVHTMPRL